MQSGGVLRRHRKHLRRAVEQALDDPMEIETVILTDTPDTHARTDTDLSDKGAPGNKDGPVITRAGRTVVRPQRYMDCTG